jgi:hypothetical protein
MIKTIKSENIANKNFIAAFIDGSFFNRTYPDEALDKIDIEIEEIKLLIKSRLDKGRNIDELESELSRFQDLKYYFPKIIKRLNDSLTVDIRDNKFDDGMQAIISALK